jgi:hypothetical protein
MLLVKISQSSSFLALSAMSTGISVNNSEVRGLVVSDGGGYCLRGVSSWNGEDVQITTFKNQKWSGSSGSVLA